MVCLLMSCENRTHNVAGFAGDRETMWNGTYRFVGPCHFFFCPDSQGHVERVLFELIGNLWEQAMKVDFYCCTKCTKRPLSTLPRSLSNHALWVPYLLLSRLDGHEEYSSICSGADEAGRPLAVAGVIWEAEVLVVIAGGTGVIAGLTADWKNVRSVITAQIFYTRKCCGMQHWLQ